MSGSPETLDLAVIGNCSISALVDKQASIVWSCLPRFDADPVFCNLLRPADAPDGGIWAIDLVDYSHSEQQYQRNSAVLQTKLFDRKGGAVEIVDFIPRFRQFGRIYRPTMIVRTLRPISGTPRIRIRLRPRYGYGQSEPATTRGSNHIRYLIPNETLRLTTDVPITLIQDETAFVLEDARTMVLGPDESLTQSVADIGSTYLRETAGYWREWCRYLAIPLEWQSAVIRAAITLKLSSFEETGAVVAAMTTSVPEAPDTERNWDYRYCWLRDAYFTVHALNRLGVTRTMEGYLSYIANIVANAGDGYLQPVFGIGFETDLTERTEPALTGFGGHGPVRVGNGAYTQVQNDGYGSVILACAQSFFDERLSFRGDRTLFERLEILGRQAVARWDQPDAGLWELRTKEQVHTFSSVMCWAAADRLARIARKLALFDRAKDWAAEAERIRTAVLEKGYNRDIGSFTSAFGGEDVDACLLLLPELGFVADDDPRFQGTLARIEDQLRFGNYVYRYIAADDFGVPSNAFSICTFWYIDRLVAAGRDDEARALFENILAARNHVGLLSEDIDVHTRRLWGNFPQTYSMVGLIQSAMKLSRPWEEAF